MWERRKKEMNGKRSRVSEREEGEEREGGKR